MNNKIYYKKTENGQLEKVQHKVIKINNRPITNPTDEQLASIEVYQRRSTQPPKCEEGYHFETNGWKVVDNMWEQQWIVVKDIEQIPMADDYDRISEDYLRQVCQERGYTKREPNEYSTSSVERWKQDAEDYVKFRDAVIQLSIEQQNLVNNGQPSQSLDEFRKSLPKIQWTIAD